MQIKHPIIGWLFNAFDAPIRFMYCRLGFLSRIFNKLMFWKLYSSDFEKLYERFVGMRVFLEKTGLSVAGKTVLELGPGNSYINAYLFLMMGAKKVILVDKFPRQIQSKKQRRFLEKELAFVRERHPEADFQLSDGCLEMIGRDLIEIDCQAVDFIYSISVLEHVKEAAATIKKMSEMLVPGGLMYHHIDMRDHYNFSAPFLFYKYSDSAWNRWMTREGLSYTNRWRYDDFKQAFKKAGLAPVQEDIQRYPLEGVRRHPMWRGRQNLDIGILDILLKK